jgi:farnesyl-diphosphate farnesyltransferase
MQSELNAILKDVSRSFYLTVRILPHAIRPQISLAYLLARATDTIADTDAIPLNERLTALDQLRERILGQSNRPIDFSRFATGAASTKAADGEQTLLKRIEDILAAVSQFAPADQQRIREVLDTITRGQQLDLKRFCEAGERCIVALQNDDELDDYTYRVAGCVGRRWGLRAQPGD